jgi:hypothetical protein
MGNRIINSLLLILSVITLITPAIINKYPLVYSDSACYLYSGFEGNVPVDRPIVYSLFIINIPFASTLWSVILLQATIITSLILICFQNLIKFRYSYLGTFITILILSYTTGASNYVSQIMPDIFSAAAIIAIGIILAIPDLSFRRRIYLFLLIIFSSLAHTSNLFTSSCLILVFLILSLIFRRKKIILLKTPVFMLSILVIFSSWLILPLINQAYGCGFKISRTKNVMIMGRLVETGILYTYLNDKCETENIKLCEFKDKLPNAAWQFLWIDDSPLFDKECLQNGGWGNCWIQKDKEYAPIINDIITTPKYLWLCMKSCFFETFHQLISFKIGYLVPQMDDGGVIGAITQHYKKEIKSYRSAKQAKETLYFNTISKIQTFVIGLSVLILILFIGLKKQRVSLSKNMKIFCLVSILGLFLNAFTCTTFSSLVDRYEGRVIWVLPLLVLLILFNKNQDYFTLKSKNQ